MKVIYPNAEKFLSKNPVKVGTVFGVRFYEHPALGDESPLIAIVGGKKKISCWYELPDTEEVSEWLSGL